MFSTAVIKMNVIFENIVLLVNDIHRARWRRLMKTSFYPARLTGE